MGLGPICAIYQAHVNRYLHHRRLVDTSASRVWCFVGDGEMDEPESIGALGVAGREHLDNLIFVVNCNLQRLDGPVRGNGKIIQELEAVFRGAGWNVIKVIWGSRWDELLARDVDGVLLDKMNTTVDGEFQKYATESGAYIREHFFGPDPRLRKLVEHLSRRGAPGAAPGRPRLPQALRRLQAGHRAARSADGHPGQDGQGLDARPRDRGPQRHPPDQEDDQGPAARPAGPAVPARTRSPTRPWTPTLRPYYRPREGSEAHEYLTARRQMLGGSLPSRVVRPKPATLPDPKVFADLLAGSGGQSVSTTMAFARLLRNLVRDPDHGPAGRPRSSPTRRGPSASSRSSPRPRSTRPMVSATRRWTPTCPSATPRAPPVSSSRRASPRPADWPRSSPSPRRTPRGSRPMLPVFLFYSMFGFQRVGDLLWALGDIRGRGILAGCTAGRTTLQGEGLQHDDGQSPLLASTNPAAHVYDPAFAYEIAIIVEDAVERILGPGPRTASGTSPSTTRDTRCRRSPRDRTARQPRWRARAASTGSPGHPSSTTHSRAAPRSASRVLFGGGDGGPRPSGRALGRRRRRLVGHLVAGAAARGDARPSGGTASTPRRPPGSHGSPPSSAPPVDRSSPSPTTCVPCPTRLPVGYPDPSSPSGPTASACPTPRGPLRSHFEMDAAHIVVAVLDGLRRQGEIGDQEVRSAIDGFGLDPEASAPFAL